jgi:hypothetical protein
MQPHGAAEYAQRGPYPVDSNRGHEQRQRQLRAVTPARFLAEPTEYRGPLLGREPRLQVHGDAAPTAHGDTMRPRHVV